MRPDKIYHQILSKKADGKKQIAILIDPDKPIDYKSIKSVKPDLFLVGGSITANDIEAVVVEIKQHTNIPVLLFPGGVLQLTNKADGILLLSLISGRNPEYLIGNHVTAAGFLKKSQLEIIPTGYMLIESGKTTSVEYISNTKPIPADKTEIAVSTALAGEFNGAKLIYLEAGSGALRPVSENLIRQVKQNISIPLIVGGGLRSESDIRNALQAGADIIVIGTAIEKDIALTGKFIDIVREFRSQL